MDKGYSIYIRDNSFLGFPTLHIVVPGLSEIDHAFCNLNRRICHMQLTENKINPLFRFATLNETECLETIEYLSQLDKEAIELFTRNSNPKNMVNRHLLLMLLHAKLGHKEEMIRCLEDYVAYCHAQQRPVRLYYQRMLDILQNVGVADTEANDYLIAHSFLAHTEKALRAIDTPTCFDCNQCPLAEGCRYPLLKEIENISQKAMRNNMPVQGSLNEIFRSDYE